MRSTDAFSALWGKTVGAEGFTMVPKALLEHYGALGLDQKDVAILTALIYHWWRAEQPPYPSLDTIQAFSGVSHATVCRRLDKMEGLGLISSEKRGRRTVRHLDGLVMQLTRVVNQSHRETPKVVDMSQGETRSRRRKETKDEDPSSPSVKEDVAFVAGCAKASEEELDRADHYLARLKAVA